MFIEYKIKYKKDGITISQRIDNAAELAVPLVKGNFLLTNFTETQAANAALQSNADAPAEGGSPVNKPGTGGVPPGSGSAPITIIGPFFFDCPKPSDEEHDDEE